MEHHGYINAPRAGRPLAAGLALWLAAVLAAPAAEPARVTNFDGVKALACALAARPYQDTRLELPRRLRELSYDAMRDIRFNPRKAVWRMERLPFQLQFFHPVGMQPDQVDIYLVDGDVVTPVPFSPDLFDYGQQKLTSFDLRGLKFSGFRIHYPLNRPDYLDELVVFQGATYFRALAQKLVYGLSARAVAINCGGPGPEEFPTFLSFWIRRPDATGSQIEVWGLFDGPSLAGAAGYVFKPGAETVVDARVALFPRVAVPRVGIAPLTSMFWYGKNSAGRPDDYRPEVHDSDGLLIAQGNDEWLWRPLANGPEMRLATLAVRGLKGFGLLQRERRFEDYQDLEALYQLRPSAWVEPVGDWGPGAVRLLNIPPNAEFLDNVVAFWAPERVLKPGEPAEWAYTLRWFGDHPGLSPIGRVTSTRTAAVPGPSPARRFLIEFAWPTVAADVASNRLETVTSASHGKLVNQHSMYNPFSQTWRIVFDVAPESPAQPVELRAHVQRDGARCTEVWTYLWMP